MNTDRIKRIKSNDINNNSEKRYDRMNSDFQNIENED